MNGRKAAIGLSLLSALVLCAIAAPNAMALKGTTAFTCEKVEPKVASEFEDEHCTKKLASTGQWKHSAKIEGKTQLTAIANETKFGEAGETKVNPKLKWFFGGTPIEFEGTGFTSCAGKISVENKENAQKQMEAAGEYCGTFTGVKVLNPKSCKINGEAVKLNEKAEAKTVVETKEGKETMFVDFKPPASGVFSEFTFANDATCALKNATFKLTGSAHANMTTSEAQLDGPTLRFTTAETKNTLKMGAAPVEFEATVTVKMLKEEGKPENPVVLTTTTN